MQPRIRPTATIQCAVTGEECPEVDNGSVVIPATLTLDRDAALRALDEGWVLTIAYRVTLSPDAEMLEAQVEQLEQMAEEAGEEQARSLHAQIDFLAGQIDRLDLTVDARMVALSPVQAERLEDIGLSFDDGPEDEDEDAEDDEGGDDE